VAGKVRGKTAYLLFALLIIGAAVFSYYKFNAFSPESASINFTYNLIRSTRPNADYKYLVNGMRYIHPDSLEKFKQDRVEFFEILAAFAGVEKGPDKGFRILESEEDSFEARVKMLWEYDSGPTEKMFYLNKIGNQWKIFQIRQML
jgi:hypothetical protein